MDTTRTILLSLLLFAAAGPTSSITRDCGDCPLDSLWWRAPSGAYRFDPSVPGYLEQAAYWAADGWGWHYHDQNDPDATVISVDSFDPSYTGYVDPATNEIVINQYYVDQCISACDFLISVLSHEFGHTAGVADFESGCETSIMSWERNRWSVIFPSQEDLCWFSDFQLGGGWECPEQPCVPFDRIGQPASPGRGGRGGGGQKPLPAEGGCP